MATVVIVSLCVLHSKYGLMVNQKIVSLLLFSAFSCYLKDGDKACC